MRFAIKTAPQNTTYEAMLDVWRAADDIDLYESAWTFDHFEPIFSDRSGPCLEGWRPALELRRRAGGGVRAVEEIGRAHV